jgi:hypothetical protein
MAALSVSRRTGFLLGWFVFLLGLMYAVVTAIGLFTLESPDSPIGHPYFTWMELLTLLIAPAMLLVMLIVHNHTDSRHRSFSLASVIFLAIMTVITSGVHTVVLAFQKHAAGIPAGAAWFFDFRWPSVVYALDILAWDWFYALAMLAGSVIYHRDNFDKTLRMLMLISSMLAMLGLLGVPLADMQLRNIGIIGYAVVGPVIFLLMGIRLKRGSRSSSSGSSDKADHAVVKG